MKKYLIHWIGWDCPKWEFHHNYTNAPGMVNCPRCKRKFGGQLTPRQSDSEDSHPAENLPIPGVSRAQEGDR